jgi:hypothetical protein
MWAGLAILLVSAVACAATDGLGGQGGSNAPGKFDTGDKLNTTTKETLVIGGPAGKGKIDTYFDAHNWVFEGTAGQTVTITAAGVNSSDPFIKLIDPSGNVLAEDDDEGGGSSAQITIDLPVTGTYTIRIDMMATGEYTIAVR